MTLTHISNYKSLLWLKQRKSFQLHFLAMSTLLPPCFKRPELPFGVVHSFETYVNLKLLGCTFLLVPTTQKPNWHFVNLLSERVAYLNTCKQKKTWPWEHCDLTDQAKLRVSSFLCLWSRRFLDAVNNTLCLPPKTGFILRLLSKLTLSGQCSELSGRFMSIRGRNAKSESW